MGGMEFTPISYLCLLAAPRVETSTGFLHSHHDYYYILCFGAGWHIYRGVFVIFFCVVRISSSQDGLPLTPSCSLDTAWPQSHSCHTLPPCLIIFARLYCQNIYTYIYFVDLYVTSLSLPARVRPPDSWKPNFSIAKVHRRNVGLSDFGLGETCSRGGTTTLHFPMS